MSTPETTTTSNTSPTTPSAASPVPPVAEAPPNDAAHAAHGKDGKGNKGGKRQPPPIPPKQNEPPKQVVLPKSDEVEVEDVEEDVVPVERSAAERMASVVEKTSVPAPAPARPPCPPVGTKLHCETFEGDTSVVCEVESVVEGEGVFVVRMPGLGDRRWPFSVERLVGNRLVYVPEDYPAIGTNTHFDSRFRKHLKNVELTKREQELLSKSRFTPPRKARPGYTWVKVLSGPVSMAGFDYNGKVVKGEHPLSKDEKAAYLEVLISTAKPLFPEKVLMDCGVV